jgi:hypothetical protein
MFRMLTIFHPVYAMLKYCKKTLVLLKHTERLSHSWWGLCFISENHPCLLRCRQGNVVKFYSTALKDATLCSKYKDERDVCVLGQCTVSFHPHLHWFFIFVIVVVDGDLIIQLFNFSFRKWAVIGHLIASFTIVAEFVPVMGPLVV